MAATRGPQGKSNSTTPGKTPARPGNVLLAYRTLTQAAAPIAPLLLRLRARRGKEDPARTPERLGHPSRPRPAGALIWFHAASVGETNAILPLINQLSAEQHDRTLLLTTGTVTSAKLAQSVLPKGAVHQFAPLDIPKFIDRFLDHWRPDAAVFAESEIWPNLIQELGARQIPLALVNGRLSERSYFRWRARARVSQPLFSRFQIVLAHNEETAQRFAALGAPRVEAVGNLKNDAPALPADAAALKALQKLTRSRPILLAASTHPGEDESIITAHISLSERHQNLLTIIAPRHPERGNAIAGLVESQGLVSRLRSADEQPDSQCDIYIANTIGELGLLYALSPIAFVGGSLIPHGGQNPIEAIKHDCAVVIGPHFDNFTDAYGALLKVEGCLAVETADGLATSLGGLFENEKRVQQLNARAHKAVAGMEGALARTMKALDPIFSRKSKPRRKLSTRIKRVAGKGVANAT